MKSNIYGYPKYDGKQKPVKRQAEKGLEAWLQLGGKFCLSSLLLSGIAVSVIVVYTLLQKW